MRTPSHIISWKLPQRKKTLEGFVLQTRDFKTICSFRYLWHSLFQAHSRWRIWCRADSAIFTMPLTTSQTTRRTTTRTTSKGCPSTRPISPCRLRGVARSQKAASLRSLSCRTSAGDSSSTQVPASWKVISPSRLFLSCLTSCEPQEGHLWRKNGLWMGC